MKDFKCKCRRGFLVFAIAILALSFLAACNQGDTVDSAQTVYLDADFSTSAYKHINNGGLQDDPIMPYNIDAITGSTLTVEGPGVETSIPLSIRELENRNDGLVRALYSDEKGGRIYEGVDLYYLLNEMIDGDNGIVLTETAHRVQIKDVNRKDIASFSLAEILRAHEEQRPIILAYGIGTGDQRIVAPFVFDAENEEEKSEGYIKELDNEDGCIKLVYDLEEYGDNDEYSIFSNAAYVYVCEEEEPGFKHSENPRIIYTASRYRDYIVTFRGDALGCELDFTVGQLEDLVRYDDSGQALEGGVGYSDYYSLANNAYWYVNEYEGLDLYKLLLYMGMQDAQTMGRAASRTTLVSFVANDGVESPESFSVDTLSYPDAFGYYNKNALDPGDGSYRPTNADLVDTGYPVLLAYGVNNYPYTIAKGDPGYLSGLSNSGGPIRVVFGKTQYNHANGFNQVQYLKDVIVGEDRLYNTHKYTDGEQRSLAQSTLSILVTGEDGTAILERNMTVGEIEDIAYGAQVGKEQRQAALTKDSYPVNGESHIYEGINLPYLLMETLGLPGTNGTVAFSNGRETIEMNLDILLREGYNGALSREGVSPLLAFAKNGTPLVEDKRSPGYVSSRPLYPQAEGELGAYDVDNSGGPLSVLIPDSSPNAADGQALMNVNHIQINLVPDAYAHIASPYDELAEGSVRFYGEGMERERTFTLGEIESRQTRIKTLDFSMLGDEGDTTQSRYRGLPLYDLLTEIGLKSNAGEVTVYGADGKNITYGLSQIKKQTYSNTLSPEKAPLCALLAFGKGLVDADSMAGLPLVAREEDAGYDARTQNDGGPLTLVFPQEAEGMENAQLCVMNVVAIQVDANDIDTWGHRMSDIYSDFLDYGFTFTLRNDDHEWSHVFTLGELEEMEDLILRDNYSVLDIGECEGIDIWKFVKRYAGDVEGIDAPVSVTVYAEDGYKNDLLSVFHMDGLTKGVANEEGERKALLLAYAVNGLPLVDSESHEGYTGLSGNMGGPLRVAAETVQGASVKYVNKLVVTLPGDGPIDIQMD